MVEERDENLLRVFDSIMKEVGYTMCMSEIYAMVANSAAKRFWVTPIRAYRAVQCIRKGKRIHDKPYPLREEMYKEINRRVTEVLKDYPNMSLLRAVSIVVEQPSPKFYMSAGTVKRIIIQLSKKAYGVIE